MPNAGDACVGFHGLKQRGGTHRGDVVLRQNQRRQGGIALHDSSESDGATVATIVERQCQFNKRGVDQQRIGQHRGPRCVNEIRAQLQVCSGKGSEESDYRDYSNQTTHISTMSWLEARR